MTTAEDPKQVAMHLIKSVDIRVEDLYCAITNSFENFIDKYEQFDVDYEANAIILKFQQIQDLLNRMAVKIKNS